MFLESMIYRLDDKNYETLFPKIMKRMGKGKYNLRLLLILFEKLCFFKKTEGIKWLFQTCLSSDFFLVYLEILLHPGTPKPNLKDFIDEESLIKLWTDNFSENNMNEEDIDIFVEFAPEKVIEDKLGFILESMKNPKAISKLVRKAKLLKIMTYKHWAILYQRDIKYSREILDLFSKVTLRRLLKKNMSFPTWKLLEISTQKGLMTEEYWKILSLSNSSFATSFFAERSPDNIFRKYWKNLIFKTHLHDTANTLRKRISSMDNL